MGDKKRYVCTEEHLGLLADRFARLVATERLFLTYGLTLDEVARRMGVNRSYLSRAVNCRFGQSFTAYVNGLRIRQAVVLIRESPQTTIDDITVQTGFADRSSFFRACKRLTGLSPTALRENVKLA